MKIKSVKELIKEHDGNYSDVGYRRGYHHGYVEAFHNIHKYISPKYGSLIVYSDAIHKANDFEDTIMKWRYTEPFDKMVLPPRMKFGDKDDI